MEKQASDPAIWDDNQRAQRVMRKMADLKQESESWTGLDARSSELDELLELAMDERDQSLTESIGEDLAALESELADLEFRLMLSGEYDDHNAILALHAGRWRR